MSTILSLSIASINAFHQKPLILFPPEASFSFDNVATVSSNAPNCLPSFGPEPTYASMYTVSRSQRERKRDEAFCAHHLFDDDRAFIAFSYSQPFHEMLRQLWNVRDTFEAWISLCRRHVTPQRRSTFFLHELFSTRHCFARFVRVSWFF